MLLLKIFGLLDIYSAIVMLLVQFDVTPWRAILTATAWLFFKAYLFKGEFASMIDLIAGIYHLIMLFAPIPIITIIFVIYLLIKGLMSMA